MRYVCLTCDYDGTIARDGKVAPSTLQALEKVRSSGRKLVLATGRQLEDLLSVFPEASVFDRIVAENGAVLYRPASQEQVVLASPPPARFVEELVRRGVEPLSVGRCVVATWHPHEGTILDTIRTMSLELQIIFNKNAVMVLPSGTNKGTGVKVALNELGLSSHNTVGIGDAENDHAFLGLCECSIAVANAVPALQERADWVTARSHGQGVEEAMQLLLEKDLRDMAPRLTRHDIVLGSTENSEPFTLPVHDSRLLIAGPSGSGKSTVVSALVERLVAAQYQVCLFDPEGDFDEFENLLTLGGAQRIPGVAEILEILNQPDRSLNINLLGVPLADRPASFQGLLAHIQELRFKVARPHWLVVDEAHHVLPADLGAARTAVPTELASFALVTVHPDRVAPIVLSSVDQVIAVGPGPEEVFNQFRRASGKRLSSNTKFPDSVDVNHVTVWRLSDEAGPRVVKVEPAKGQRKRHKRKYAAGELGEDRSFYFRGPEGKLNLRAQNMTLFAQLAEGLDEDTWKFHLTHLDYSRWLRDTIKDEEIAKIVAAYEKDSSLSPNESRQRILEAIRKHYTAPA
jgi:hydroxymethylpyrimidine pyrophosphatase-like HAD family hydrolase/energy-coupling factor transporter ATP-binding protein EcfA2